MFNPPRQLARHIGSSLLESDACGPSTYAVAELIRLIAGIQPELNDYQLQHKAAQCLQLLTEAPDPWIIEAAVNEGFQSLHRSTFESDPTVAELQEQLTARMSDLMGKGQD